MSLASPARAQTTSWKSLDVGAPAVAGSAVGTDAAMTLTAAGSGVTGTADEFQFAYQQMSGDIDIRVRLDSLTKVNSGTAAGLMIRDTTKVGAKHAALLLTSANRIEFRSRSKANKDTTTVRGIATSAPVWLRLVKTGTTIEAFTSTDGDTWTSVGSATVNVGDDPLAGLVASSTNASRLTEAAFSDFEGGEGDSEAATALPSPWTTATIGSPSLSGWATYSSGTFSLTGAGSDVFGTKDQFQYVYQRVKGNTQIVARVGSLTATDPWAKAGVMIRNSLTANSRHAFMLVSGSQGWAFQRRLANGGTSYSASGSSGKAPGWVRIVREGNLISAYQSTNGTTWTLVGTDTISLSSNVYVGLAVTSHNTGTRTTAAFTSVTVGAPSASNTAPSVSITSPAAGTTFTSGATIALAASATDVDGSVTKVDFYDGSTLIGSDSTSPYSYSWKGAASGSHTLKAIATDNGGATTTSSTVKITVGAGNSPPNVRLTSPSSGATFSAPATISITAVPSDTDGTIASVKFYNGSTLLATDTSAPYSYTWTGVAAGTYTIKAVATDDDGATDTSTATVTVNATSNKAPTVSLTSPSASATFTAPATVNLAATAADSDGSIASVKFYNGSTLLGTDTSSPYSYSWTSVAAGTYSLTAVATDNKGATTTSSTVTITVNSASNKAPTVSLTSPSASATFTAPATVSLAATASDSDGSIASVKFYNGSTLLATDTSSPYSYSWTNVAAGTYSLKAVATDNKGATTTSSTVSITVNPASNKAPTVSLTSPGSGASFTAPATVSLAATAADSDGSIARVEFYNGSTLLATDTSSPYSYSWTNVAAGTYSVTAVAYDNSGAKTTSAAVSVTVKAPSSSTPTTLVFTPPSDYSSNVTSVSVEIRKAGTSTTSTPAASKSLGKPAASGGEVSVDISSVIDPLASGSYYAVVVTTNSAGSTPSAASANFTK